MPLDTSKSSAHRQAERPRKAYSSLAFSNRPGEEAREGGAAGEDEEAEEAEEEAEEEEEEEEEEERVEEEDGADEDEAEDEGAAAADEEEGREEDEEDEEEAAVGLVTQASPSSTRSTPSVCSVSSTSLPCRARIVDCVHGYVSQIHDGTQATLAKMNSANGRWWVRRSGRLHRGNTVTPHARTRTHSKKYCPATSSSQNLLSSYDGTPTSWPRMPPKTRANKNERPRAQVDRYTQRAAKRSGDGAGGCHPALDR